MRNLFLDRLRTSVPCTAGLTKIDVRERYVEGCQAGTTHDMRSGMVWAPCRGPLSDMGCGVQTCAPLCDYPTWRDEGTATAMRSECFRRMTLGRQGQGSVLHSELLSSVLIRDESVGRQRHRGSLAGRRTADRGFIITIVVHFILT